MTEKNTGSKKKAFFFGTGLIVIFVGVMVFSAISTSFWGVELGDIDQQISKIEEENRLITTQIVQSSSLTKLYAKTEELGFAKPTSIVYLNNNKSAVALR